MSAILCVESRKVERARLAKDLEAAGHEVSASDTVAAARTAMRRQAFDLVVAAWSLLDGTAADLTWGRPTATSPAGVSVLALCETGGAEERLSLLRSGVVDCVGQPYDAQFLAARVAAAIGRRTGTSSTSSPGAARRILLVDDSVTYGSALGHELQKDGHDIILAPNARLAFEYATAQSPDLVISDYFLPDDTGADLCVRLRQLPGMQRKPIVIMTGREKSSLRERVQEAKASEFIVKSKDLEGIRLQVRATLEGRGSRPPAVAPAPSAAPVRGAEGPSALLDRVIEASGLSKMVGRASLVRALSKAGLDPERLSPTDLPRALGEIERVLRFFMDAEVAAERMATIGRILGRS